MWSKNHLEDTYSGHPKLIAQFECPYMEVSFTFQEITLLGEPILSSRDFVESKERKCWRVLENSLPKWKINIPVNLDNQVW